MEITISCQPKQLELLRLLESNTRYSATWIGYGGALGGGKSAGIRRVMLARRLKHPRTKGIIFDNKYHFKKSADGLWQQPRCKNEWIISLSLFEKKMKQTAAASAARSNAAASRRNQERNDHRNDPRYDHQSPSPSPSPS